MDGSEELAFDATDAVQTENPESLLHHCYGRAGTSQLYRVTSCIKPIEAWDSLWEHFKGKTLANKLYLKKRYFRTEMEEGSFM